MNRPLRKLLELERLFGVDMLPIRKAGRGRADPVGSAPESPAAKAGRTATTEPSEWLEFRKRVLACTKCEELCAKRTQVVFGVGSLTAPLMFVGEAPGEDEDKQGEPFVGRAGQLLTRTLQKLGVSRSQIYIANVLKCRPPGNRTPQMSEMANCMPYLLKQMQIIKPKILCVLGNIAAQALLNTPRGITQLRGRYHEFQGVRVFAAFHPAYVLRNMNQLTMLEADMRQVCTDAGLIQAR